MVEDLRRKLVDLEREALCLRAEIERVESEVRRFAEERNGLNSRMRNLKREAANFRKERNALNEEVRNLKVILMELKREYWERLDSIRDLRNRIRKHLKMKPSRREDSLKKEIEEIDWRIQTTPLPLEEEKRLVERVKSLEKQLNFYHKLNAMKNELSILEGRLKKIKDEIALYREQITETVEKSQFFHEKMIECLKKMEEFKPKVDEINKKYGESRKKLSALRLKYKKLLGQISAIKKIIREEEARKKAEALSALKEKIGREALKKLKKGEKISFEEFKILAEQGKI